MDSMSVFGGRGRSLRGRLAVLWVISVVAAGAAGTVLFQLYRQSSVDQTARAEAMVGRACDEIAGRYQFYVAGWSEPPADLADAGLAEGLRAVALVALARLPGVEGGIWQRDEGSLAFADPARTRADIADADIETIRAVNADASAEERPVGSRQVGARETLLLQACPLGGPIAGVTAWAMTRVATGQGAGFGRLLLGLGVLAASVLASAAWMTHLLLTWSRKLGAIEVGLGGHAGVDPPLLALTGERELDRIVGSLNAAAAKMGAMRAEATALAGQMEAAARLAALGRVAAGIAHEIRNPIAAMRLKAENALLGDDARRVAALEVILGQVGRLDGLLRDLLTLTHKAEPVLAVVDVGALLAEVAAFHAEVAARAGVSVSVSGGAGRWMLDVGQIRRALDNLVLNAIQAGGSVVLSAAVEGEDLVLRVSDDGPGLPDAVLAHLFEPFVTARSDGTGLGLSIVREILAAHGGRAVYRAGNPGGVFALMVPRREA